MNQLPDIKIKSIEWVDIDTVHPWSENINEHPEQQIQELMDQFLFNGMSSPLEVEVGTNDIVCGCGRWLAAKQLGMKQVPVYFREYDSYSHKFARMTADNGLNRQSILNYSLIHKKLGDLHLPDVKFLGIQNFRFEPDLNTEVVENLKKEWAGMPSYEMQDSRSWKSIIIHFENEMAFKDFQEKLGMELLESTKSSWYPQRERQVHADKAYVESES
jgi:hypothetical protein